MPTSPRPNHLVEVSHTFWASLLDVLLRLVFLLGRFIGPEEALADLRLIHNHLERIESGGKNECAGEKSVKRLRRGSERLNERAMRSSGCDMSYELGNEKAEGGERKP